MQSFTQAQHIPRGHVAILLLAVLVTLLAAATPANAQQTTPIEVAKAKRVAGETPTATAKALKMMGTPIDEAIVAMKTEQDLSTKDQLIALAKAGYVVPFTTLVAALRTAGYTAPETAKGLNQFTLNQYSPTKSAEWMAAAGYTVAQIAYALAWTYSPSELLEASEESEDAAPVARGSAVIMFPGPAGGFWDQDH